MDDWKGVKAGLRIDYIDQKLMFNAKLSEQALVIWLSFKLHILGGKLCPLLLKHELLAFLTWLFPKLGY